MKRFLSVGLFALCTLPAFAANNTLPNGKPFQNLQNQINVINLTIAQQKAIYDAKFAALAAKNDQQDALIGAISVALDLVRSRVAANESDIEALKLASALQARLITEINSRLIALQASTGSNFANLYQQTSLIHVAIDALGQRVASLESASAMATTEINQLKTEMATYRNRLAYLNTLLGSFCSSGSVVTGIYATGQPRCQAINQLGSVFYVRASLRSINFCDTTVPLLGCVDTDYYEYGTANCPPGTVVTGGGFELGGSQDSGGSNFQIRSRPTASGWYVQSIDHGDQNWPGTAYAMCLRTQ